MDYDIVSSELEEEFSWRYTEIRKLQNILSLLLDENEKKVYRKSLVVMLYSHFEGFFKFTFLYYIAKINAQKYKRKQLNKALITASMNTEFLAYENLDRKCKIFQRQLPDDTEIHRYSRRIDFLDAFSEFLERIASIPDNVVDTESNLKPIVLRKILFRLGFDSSIAKKYDNSINRLLSYRNDIAHGGGKFRQGFTNDDYTDIKNSTLQLMNDIKELVAHSLRDESFLADNEQYQ